MMPARRFVLVPLLVTLLACAPATRREHPSAPPSTSVPSAARLRTSAPAGSATPQMPSGTIRVEIGDDLFTPPQITMAAGTSVTWVNLGQNPHTATAHDDSFASPTLLYGGTYTHTFAARGRHFYTCLYHPSMFGELVVE